MDVLRHLEALLGRFLEHSNDAHHRVSQAALETLAAYIECFAEHFEGYLVRLTPKVFLKISDSKETTRDAAVAVLEAIRAAYDSDVLLPVLRMGINVVLSDVDCVWSSSPTPMFHGLVKGHEDFRHADVLVATF